MKIKRLLNVALIILALIIAFVIFYLCGFNWYCPSKLFFDFDCAGCGVTRMCLSILNGQFYQAFRFNPLMFILLPFAFIFAIYSAVVYVLGKPNKVLRKTSIWVYIILLIVLVAFSIMRNIPLFSFLAPTVI